MIQKIVNYILSVALVVVLYWMLMPLLTMIVNITLKMGAPSAAPLFYLKIAPYGFAIFFLAAFLILAAWIYKKTHDTGREEMLYQ